MSDPNLFVYVSLVVCGFMLLWDTIEVGRNDAANIVNAVFGARILKRRIAVYIAGFATVIGACTSSGVIETIRNDIFDPSLFTAEQLLTIYVCVYITDTVLLYTYSSFGMPVSTTAQLVFALLGGAIALGGPGSVHWDSSSQVIFSIIASIFISGIFGFIFQKIIRNIIGFDLSNTKVIAKHGPWIAGILTTGFFFFMIMKGMKNISFVHDFNDAIHNQYGYIPALTVVMIVMTILFYILMFLFTQTMTKWLFPSLAILGMVGLAVAFGQNDLANCASPGIASYMVYRYGENHGEMDVPFWLLLGCGILLFAGMTTKRAQRVTRAEVNTGSQGDIVRLYAPKWCIQLAKLIVKKSDTDDHPSIPPENLQHKTHHYDALRAAVITTISASVIAFASGMKMPVSTTYITFACVIATGWADKIFVHGDATLKMGRTIWVIFTWFSSAVISAAVTAVCVWVVAYTGTIGIFICIAANLLFRHYMKSASDNQEEKVKKEAHERKQLLMQTAGGNQSIKYASEDDEDQL